MRQGTDALIGSLERRLRIDVRYVLKGGFWLGSAQVVMGVIALGLSMAFAHFVPKDVYGTYRYLLSMFWALTAFSLSGLPSALVRAVAKGAEGEYLPAFRLSILGGIPMFLVSAGFSTHYYLNGNAILGLGCLIIAIIGPFLQGAYLYGSFLEGRRQFRANAFFGIIINLVPALMLGAMMFLAPSPLVFLATYLVSYVAVGLLIGAFVFFRFRPNRIRSKDSFLRLSTHFSAMNILATISQHIDKLLVFQLLGPVQLAVYAFATTLPDQVKGLFGNLETLAFPKFANRSATDAVSGMARKLLLFTGLLALIALAYILIAPFAFSLLFPTYMEAVPYSQLYALALIPLASIIPTSLLQAHAAKRHLYILHTLSPIVLIGLFYALTSLYGLLGAVLARIFGRVFSLGLSLYLTRSYVREQRTQT